MNEILLVTGNSHKLAEWQRLMPADVVLKSQDIKLDELQSDDPQVIVTDKVKRAYEQVGMPVIVEDVSAGLVDLNGLPGPFIKFFIESLGQDALYQLAGKKDGAQAIASCSAAYYDGSTLLSVKGDVHGTIVAPRGDSTFGFDVTFVPDGYDQTYAEMEPSLKNSLSHRAIAVALMLDKMKANNIIS
jgi:inosine triphosphate pyrophosphatase